MNEDDSTQVSGLRRRQPASDLSPDEDPASTISSPTSSWQAELAHARQALADRVRQQQENDGSTSVPHVGQATSSGDRRGSSDSEGDSDEVRQLLTGSWRAEEWDGQEKENREREVEVLAEEEGMEATAQQDTNPPEGGQGDILPQPDAPPDHEHDENMCRICFEGEDPELGRLFSPCQCRGTSRYVHVVCLDRWRIASAGARSFYKCGQCGYEYKLRRTKISGLAQNPIALMTLTVLSFALIIFLAGFVASWILAAVEERSARLTGSPFEDFFVQDYVIMGESVREAVAAINSIADGAGTPALTWRGGGGPDDSDDSDDISKTAYRFFKRLSSTSRPSIPTQPTLLRRTVQHFVKGFSLVGLSSFFSSFVASAIMGPFGLRNTLFRAVRPQRRNGDNQVNASQLLILAFIALGIVKAVSQVYRGVKWLSKLALKRVEGLVMEV